MIVSPCTLFLWTPTKQVQTHAGPSDTYKYSHFAHVLSLCQPQIFFLCNLFISKHLCSSLRSKYNDLNFPIFIRKYTHCAICLQRANYLILICKYNLSKTLKRESRKNSEEVYTCSGQFFGSQRQCCQGDRVASKGSWNTFPATAISGSWLPNVFPRTDYL